MSKRSNKEINMGCLKFFFGMLFFPLLLFYWAIKLIINIVKKKSDKKEEENVEITVSNPVVSNKTVIFTPAPEKKNLKTIKLSSDFYKNILPYESTSLLWFLNGDLKNCDDENEPSVIDMDLPITVECDEDLQYNDLHYYPNYRGLSPAEKRFYLNWLKDVTLPVPIGYVFVFYYGLERLLFTEKYEDALMMIHKLRQHHLNKSFQTYSFDAILIGCAIHDRYDLLEKLVPVSSETPNAVFMRIFLRKKMYAGDIIHTYKSWGFTNNRYIKNNPAEFAKELTNLLFQNYGNEYIEISDKTYQDSKKTTSVMLANYQLSERFAAFTDITSNIKLSKQVLDLLNETHENVKVILREQRKSHTDVISANITTDHFKSVNDELAYYDRIMKELQDKIDNEEDSEKMLQLSQQMVEYTERVSELQK